MQLTIENGLFRVAKVLPATAIETKILSLLREAAFNFEFSATATQANAKGLVAFSLFIFACHCFKLFSFRYWSTFTIET